MINKNKVDKATLTKSMKKIKDLEKTVINDQKKFKCTYYEYKKIKYSIDNNKNKSTTLIF